VARAASCCISRKQRRRPTARREAPLWKGLLPFRKSAWRTKSFAWSRCTMKRSNACIVRYHGRSRGWKDASWKFMLLLRDDKVIESRVSVYEGTWDVRCQCNIRRIPRYFNCHYFISFCYNLCPCKDTGRIKNVCRVEIDKRWMKKE